MSGLLPHTARTYAAMAHEGQFRADGVTPYVRHPWAVGDTLSFMGEKHAVVCAGYLHDVPEDTKYTLEDVREAFGNEVADLVDWMTNKTHHLKHKVVRGVRKQMDRERLAKAPRAAKLIKLVDRIDNLKDVGKDPKFMELYKVESLLLLDVLRGTHEDLEKELETLCRSE